MRQILSLAGSWEFQVDPDASMSVENLKPDRELQVPMPWQAAFPELEHYSGYAWYRRYLELDQNMFQGELLLHFGAVDYWCQVFVNGKLAGQHEGGYTPFTLPVRTYLHSGRNEIALRVYDSVQAHILVPRWPNYPATISPAYPPFDANHIPHGKQEWYINVGGVWQDVTLTAVPKTYLNHVAVTPNIQNGEAQLKVELAGDSTALESGTIQIKIQDNEGTSWETSLKLIPGQSSYTTIIKVNEPRLWNTETPYLYTATVQLQLLKTQEDELVTRFGFREITTRDGQLLLNGEPLFLLSALDQDMYNDTIYTVPSEEYLRDQFRKAKQLGLNNLRCHIKPPDPRYLDLADEMGLLVWAEIPSWRTFYPKGTVHPNQLNLDETIKERVEQTLVEMIQRDYNHPSLIIWTIVNEDWGTALPLSSSDRTWVAEMYERCKQLDPTRLVIDNSACPHAWGPNVHVESDLDDFHVYANIPDQADKWEQTIEQFNLRPVWTYSSQGDSRRSGQEPLILSEFGNWGLPSLKALRQPTGSDPDWFKLGPWWSPFEGEPGWPKGVEERFYGLGLDAIWGDYEKFAEATQWHQFAAMKFEIETMRRQPNLSGYVITELADIYWESNGLLDFLRNPKVYHEQFHMINNPDMLIPHLRHYATWDDQPVRTHLYAAHYSQKDWAGSILSRTTEKSPVENEELSEDFHPGEVKSIGLRHWQMPQVEQSRLVSSEFRLSNAKGEELARNQLDLLVLPAQERQARYQEEVAVIMRMTGLESVTSDLGIEANVSSPIEPGNSGIGQSTLNTGASTGPVGFVHAIQKLGYKVSAQLTSNTGVAVTNYPNAELLKWVREGGDLLFISTGSSPFYWVQGRGGAYSGNWMTSFSWLRPGAYRRLRNVANPLQLPFKRIMPTGTILGLPVTDPGVQSDFLAGMIAGWVNHPAVHTVQFRYGKGRVIMTTFELVKGLREYHDPVAIAMLHDLIEYLVSEECQPNLRANY